MKQLLPRHHRERGIQRAQMLAANARQPEILQNVPASEWPVRQRSVTPIAVFHSSRFLVQVYAEANDIIRLSVNRTKLNSMGDWEDGISWDDLQEIKNQCGYSDREAVEVYPVSVDVVNVANIRHLWVMPTPLAFVWKKSLATKEP